MPQPKQSAYAKFVAHIESKGGEVGLNAGPPSSITVRLPGLGVISSQGDTVDDAIEAIQATIAQVGQA